MWSDRGKQKYTKSDRKTDCLTNTVEYQTKDKSESGNWAMEEIHIYIIVGFNVPGLYNGTSQY